ncbi:hypothetical protein ABIE85_003579 [Bradyrhizobium diazoefficiens]|uniref:Uncharacterized protein n=1 Tax=Bradyrhizobium diazoefficiens TaxID=1355477 RepID=A0A810C487_9BRAD|nr:MULTISPECIES: hypothetical protein [Bradyrhizobium]MBP1063748.1 hypothetical protein [Bradyrhizobium japonicum]MDA9536075.1 hypothetical protein [Bradyrhizobium sp. CCBAU 21362]BBZ96767.1 hypothetical protein F07S3_66000 [Bradyrhizobium diazoefficiens]BCA05851.1 hypothetical protein H12S4_67550 [Bradyrhizobium diazoefficiens]BCA14452.1 hypothetical protein BDHF08_62990 [Bradyrhizobium diazoefficiens]
MKPGLFSASLIGLLAVLTGPDRLPIGEQSVMVSKANADDSGKESAKESAKAGRASSMPMARDPSAAVAEEYEAARRTGTREAFELFIARHGDDPLADQARAELKRLPR